MIGIPCIFKNKYGHKFELSPIVVEQITQFIQYCPKMPEAGGVLLGRFIIESDDIVVDKITTPMKGDRQSRFHFFRSAKMHQEQIAKSWSASDGTCNYLGEWHTHAEPDPTPSFLDKAEWRRKLLFDMYDHDSLFFIIVGTEQIKVWQGKKKSLSFDLLSRICSGPIKLDTF
jgi:integrative and conjugative element protein (TIGR02256 family)